MRSTPWLDADPAQTETLDSGESICVHLYLWQINRNDMGSRTLYILKSCLGITGYRLSLSASKEMRKKKESTVCSVRRQGRPASAQCLQGI